MRPVPVVPGTRGTPAGATAAFAEILSPITSMAAAGGPIQVSPASVTARAKAGVLGEEAVAGVHRLRAGPDRRVHDRGAVEVVRDVHGDVGRAHVRGPGVGVGVDGDTSEPAGAQGRGDADRDLAAVGDQDAREHLPHIRKTPKRGSSSGAWAQADSARPRTVRVSSGSMTPSSHSRAVE